jgi:integrase
MPTVDALLDDYIARKKALHVWADGTLRSYTAWAKVLKREFGKFPVEKLTKSIVESHYGAMLKHYAPPSIRGMHTLLVAALDDAVQNGVIVTHGAKYAQTPRFAYAAAAEKHLDEASVKKALAAADKDFYIGHAIKLGVGTGMRRCEMLGLDWEDFDFAAKTVKVRVSKTAAGVRTIALPAGLATDLERLAKVDRYKGPLFRNENGHRLSAVYFSRRVRAFFDALGMKEVSIHNLRHTHASTLVNAGMSLPNVAARLGHAGPHVTLRMYAHADKSADAELAATVDKLF